MIKTITAATITCGLLFTAAPAAHAADRLVWKDRILLTLEGGQCEANNLTAPTFNVWIVPTLVRDGRRWVAGENTVVKVLINRGGTPCT